MAKAWTFTFEAMEKAMIKYGLEVEAWPRGLRHCHVLYNRCCFRICFSLHLVISKKVLLFFAQWNLICDGLSSFSALPAPAPQHSYACLITKPSRLIRRSCNFYTVNGNKRNLLFSCIGSKSSIRLETKLSLYQTYIGSLYLSLTPKFKT